MRAAIVGFAVGVCLLQTRADLPSIPLSGAGVVLPLIAGLLWLALCGAPSSSKACSAHTNNGLQPAGVRLSSWMKLLFALFAGGMLGFYYAAGMAHWRLADRLDPGWEGRDVVLTGVIAGLPQPFDRGVRFEFAVEAVEPRDAVVPRRVSISWYNGLTPEEFQVVMPVRAGERWRLATRLRLPHGLANPHGFDYEVWLLERGLRATGFVRARGGSERIDELVWHPAYLIERARELVRQRFQDTLEGSAYAGILIALAIGDQRSIDPEAWQVFAKTGISHLMSISGLHVTMVSGLFAWFVFNVWRRIPRLALRLPAQKAAALAAMLGALAYCLISGFAVPAQRTLYMVSVVALAMVFDRAGNGSQVLAWALALVLLLDPWAVASAGFWLSFGAVALIFYVGACRPQARGWLAQWAVVQWAVTLGLAPLTLVIFQQVSLVSPLANAVAIPLVSLVVTPLALLGAVLPLEFPLRLAHLLLEWLMPLMEFLARLDAAVWTQHAPALWSLPLAMLGACWLLAPRGVPARALGVVLLLPMFVVKPPPPETGELWLTFLDVGQGMAVEARTRHHVLIYDTGASWGAQSDSGERVVLPYLRGEGVSAIDTLVVSHDDNDHAGGAASLLGALPVAMLASSLPQDHPLNRRDAGSGTDPGSTRGKTRDTIRSLCAAGRVWHWDGIRFEFLHPTSRWLGNPFLSANEGSCVLRIDTPSGSALLAGDIEKASEELLLSQGARLKADVLLVPHHGSGTSSTPAFVEAVAPAYAVFQVGYRNRFGHPRADVLARYVDRNVQVLRNDADGAIRVRFTAGGIQVARQREISRRYWQGR